MSDVSFSAVAVLAQITEMSLHSALELERSDIAAVNIPSVNKLFSIPKFVSQIPAWTMTLVDSAYRLGVLYLLVLGRPVDEPAMQ